MRTETSCQVTVSLLVLLCLAPRAVEAQAKSVSSPGQAYRILVRVPPRVLKGRAMDQMPARLRIQTSLDPASIQVSRYDPRTGEVLAGKIDFRFDSAPATLFMSHYWPDDGRRGGTLVWKHEQHGDAPSYYAVYFNDWNRDAGAAPRGWIGDGDIEYVPRGAFPQVLLVRPLGFDWDDDGRTDVIVGDELGYVTLYRNVGSSSQPRFTLGEPLLARGKPVKVQWCAAPVIVDWNADGLPDLLVAQEPQGVIRYFQNVGTRKNPNLVDRGLLQADGAVLKPPYLPVPEMPPGIFGDKYGSIPTAADWDGNGKISLLVGTYITGEVYLYKNVGRNPDGTPKLHFVGPLVADGKNLDVVWNSTPSAADLNGDGRIEVVSGSFGMSSTGSDRPQDSRLHYYVRSGESLHELPFPFEDAEGTVSEKLADSGGAPFSTSLTDINGDGLVDLLVGTNGGTVVYFQNVGTSIKPLFRFVGTLEGSWVPHRWSFNSVVDFYGNGRPALLDGGYGTKVELAKGPSFAQRIELKTRSGKSMGKSAAHGDDFGSAQYYDFDYDGKPDLLFGTVDGNVLLYRNVGTRTDPGFDEAEAMLMFDGTPLVAGFPSETTVTDFTILQGNRAVPSAADFNSDGKTDLIVGNAIGQVLYFENVGDNTHPRFARPREVLKCPGRVFLTSMDWNGDGLADLIVASSGGKAGEQLLLLRHTADKHAAAFLPPLLIPAPAQIPYPMPSSVDWDHDGDQDMLVASSYGFVYLFDGSFIDGGYAQGEVIATERRADIKAKSAATARKTK
jgi:hypothetical protein